MTIWGVVALVIWGVAMLSATVSALVPDSFFAGLHTSRLQGANVNQLRTQVAALAEEAQRMKRENALLVQRFSLSEENTGAVTRRVGALELTIPRMLEAIPADTTIDRSSITSSIGAAPTVSFDADGGSVSVTQKPLAMPSSPVAQLPQDMPSMPVVEPDPSAFGIALGPPLDADEAEAQWQSLTARVGTLLIGLGPVLADLEGTTGKRLVAGPLVDRATATALCGRMSKVGISCAAVPFIGMPMPLLN